LKQVLTGNVYGHLGTSVVLRTHSLRASFNMQQYRISVHIFVRSV